VAGISLYIDINKYTCPYLRGNESASWLHPNASRMSIIEGRILHKLKQAEPQIIQLFHRMSMIKHASFSWVICLNWYGARLSHTWWCPSQHFSLPCHNFFSSCTFCWFGASIFIFMIAVGPCMPSGNTIMISTSVTVDAS